MERTGGAFVIWTSQHSQLVSCSHHVYYYLQLERVFFLAHFFVLFLAGDSFSVTLCLFCFFFTGVCVALRCVVFASRRRGTISFFSSELGFGTLGDFGLFGLVWSGLGLLVLLGFFVPFG